MANFKKASFYALAIVVMGTILSLILKPVTLQASSFHRVYFINDQAFQFTPFFWTIAVIGGCITVTLAYVSWKKYKAEKQSKRKDKSFD